MIGRCWIKSGLKNCEYLCAFVSIYSFFHLSLALLQSTLLLSLDSDELLQYKEKQGNTDVAVRKGFEEYKQLANWAGLQRVSIANVGLNF